MKSFIFSILIYGVVVFVWAMVLIIKAFIQGTPISEISISVFDLFLMFVGVLFVTNIIIGVVSVFIYRDNNNNQNPPTSGSSNYQAM